MILLNKLLVTGVMASTCLWATLNTQAQTCDTLGNNVCHCHTVGDMSPAGIMIGHPHPAKGWMVSYRYMLMNMAENSLNGTPVSNDEVYAQNYLMAGNSMQMHMNMMMVMYGFSARFSVMLMPHYNINSMDMSFKPGHKHGNSSHSGTSHSMNTNGLGDTKLYGLYAIILSENHTLISSLGLNLPSGSINKKGDIHSMYPGERYPYMMQLGTGTLDFMPGISYTYSYNNFSFNIQAAGTIRPFYNTVGYNIGNEITLNSWVAHKLLPWLSVSLRGEAIAWGKINGIDNSLSKDYEPGANAINYGGKRVNTYCGLNVYLRNGCLKNQRLSIEGGLPVYQQLNGLQQPAKFNLIAGWVISF